MTDHVASHEERLFEILGAGPDPRAAFRSSELSGCAVCARIVGEVESVEHTVAGVGQREREVLERSLSDVRSGTEGRAERALRSHARQGGGRSGSFPRHLQWGTAAAAAAAALIVWLVFLVPNGDDGLDLPDVMMGHSVELVSPVDAVQDYALFKWTEEGRSTGGSYRVRVYDATGDDHVLFTTSPKLSEPEWTPDDDVTGWPVRIYWELEIASGASVEDVDVVGSAYSWRSP